MSCIASRWRASSGYFAFGKSIHAVTMPRGSTPDSTSETREAARQQSRADEQHERHRDFHGHQHSAQAERTASRRRATPALLQRVVEIDLAAWRAGSNPNTSPVTIDTTAANTRTRRSM